MSASEIALNNSNQITSLAGIDAGEMIRANRDETGKFIPGNCANPDGRPKSRLFSEELKELLSKVSDTDESGAEKLGKKMFKLADQDKDEWLALAAIKEIADRTEGRPVQNTNLRAVVVMMPAEAALAETWDAAEPD